MKILPREWYRMTFAEHIFAWSGYLDHFYSEFSMHRRTAYEIYLSRPKAKGHTPKTIQQFMPLPSDSDYRPARSTKIVKEIHSAFLEKLNSEKSNEQRISSENTG